MLTQNAPKIYADSGTNDYDPANLPDEHALTYVPPYEPRVGRIVDETYVNQRQVILAKQPDHAMLTPLPAPAARPAQWTYAFTERPFGHIYDPTIEGEKVNISPLVRPAPLQDMAAQNAYHVNTLRIEPQPWDNDLY